MNTARRRSPWPRPTETSVLVAKLLKAGADANAARWDGETALMIAANAGSVDVVKQLIARGADVNLAESRKGQTALMWAAAEGHPEVVQVLIDQKADIRAASKSGFTALVFAAIKNDPKSVQELLAAGADANYALPDGTKVLLVAASHKSTLAAGALVDGGADPNVADRGGNSPLHTAAQARRCGTHQETAGQGCRRQCAYGQVRAWRTRWRRRRFSDRSPASRRPSWWPPKPTTPMPCAR